ncbi:MAG: response regulator [Actinobacteria bacterium]|nr:response regulator [Actinomycetota bacterium]
MGERELRVLIVEDMETEAWTIGKVLEKKLGASFDIALDENEARHKLNSGEYDLVTLDYKLSNFDGLELLREIVEYENCPPVIFITGDSSESIAVEAFKIGALGHVIKQGNLYTRLIEESRFALAKAAYIKANIPTEREILEQSLLIHDLQNKASGRASNLGIRFF